MVTILNDGRKNLILDNDEVIILNAGKNLIEAEANKAKVGTSVASDLPKTIRAAEKMLLIILL